MVAKSVLLCDVYLLISIRPQKESIHVKDLLCFRHKMDIIRIGTVCKMNEEGCEMCTRSELNTILLKIAHAYKMVYGDQLVKIVLYGSYARGDHQEDSDIDVVAIVHGERVHLQQQLKKVWDISSDLELEYGTIVSPTVIPSEEFEQYKNILPYYRNIMTEGVDIVA